MVSSSNFQEIPIFSGIFLNIPILKSLEEWFVEVNIIPIYFLAFLDVLDALVYKVEKIITSYINLVVFMQSQF